MNTNKFLSMIAIAGLVLTSCSSDDDSTVVNPEEVITTMTVNLVSDSDTVTLSFFDEDGADGPTAPVPTVSGSLSANTTYNGSITILNETEDPIEDITEEVRDEADEHQFFFISENVGITTAYTDRECDYDDEAGCDNGNTNPVGLTFTLSTSDTTGDGTLRFVLRHEPNKEAEGVAEGNIANAGGDADIDYTFNISVQ